MLVKPVLEFYPLYPGKENPVAAVIKINKTVLIAPINCPILIISTISIMGIPIKIMKRFIVDKKL